MIRELVKKMYHASETFVRNHKKTLLIAVFFVAVGFTAWNFFGIDAALAQAPTPAPTAPATTVVPKGANGVSDASAGIASGSFWMDLFSKILLSISRLFLSLTLFILTFIIEIAGYNGFLNASAVNVGWVMVRDITNMGFVVILLVIAFGTILGVEHYEWKKMLVKMVVAAVVVNFSRTICGLMIDVAQVVMITFVNGIAATAGGNLIRMFNLDSIRDLSTSADPKTFDSTNYFIASIGAVFFSAMVMCVLAVFMVMLVARMIVLWVLIVLSPLAFVLSVLPQTEGYANQWWSEFGKNVITGPVLLFFVWLSFVTAGNGKINDQIAGASVTGKTSNAGSTDESSILKGNTSGIGSALEWDNMANFIIAIGMLMVGARAAAQLGGVGGEWAGEAVSVGKKIGMYASGAVAARWAVSKAGEAAARPVMRGVNTVENLAKIYKGKFDEKRNAKASAIENAGDARKEVDKYNAKLSAGKTLSIDEAKKMAAAQKTIEKAGIFGQGGAVGRYIGSRLTESAGRADKRVEDLEKAAHAQEVIVEETYSTSKSWQGQMKLGIGVREHQIEQFSKAKREQKYADKERQLMGYDSETDEFDHSKADETFMERENAIIEGQAKTKAAMADIESHKAEGILEAERSSNLASREARLEKEQIKAETVRAKRKLGAEGQQTGAEKSSVFEQRAVAEKSKIEMESKRSDLEQDAQIAKGVFDAKAIAEGHEARSEEEKARETLRAEQRANTAVAKAAAEQAQIETTGARERDVAAARDEILVKLNRASEATNLQKTVEKQFKARKDAQIVGDYQIADARYTQQLARIKQAVDSGDVDAARELRKGALMMTIGNLDRHAAYAVNIQNSALSTLRQSDPSINLNSSMEENADAMRENIAQFFTAALGKKVTVDNLDDEFKTLTPDERYSLYIESEKAAGEGALALAGMMQIERNEVTGDPEVQLTDLKGKKAKSTDPEKVKKAVEAAVKHVVGRRTNALSGNRINNLVGFSGSVDKNGMGRAVVDTVAAKDILVKLVSPLTGNQLTSVNEFSKLDMASVFDNSENADQLNNLIGDLTAQSVDIRGATGLLREAANRMENTGRKEQLESAIKAMSENFEKIRKANKDDKAALIKLVQTFK